MKKEYELHPDQGMVDSIAGIPPLASWPDVLREYYEERIGIKLDSGIERHLAEYQALIETWERRFTLAGIV